MNTRALCITFVGTVAVTAILMWGTTIPLGVPGEWTWPRIPAGPGSLLGMLFALTIGAAYVALVSWGSRRIQGSSRAEVCGWLMLLVACSFAWLWTIQECVSAPANLGKVPYTLFYPRSSGYYWQAWHDVESTAVFLSSYEELLAEQDYLHLGTHPPGLTLAYCGLLTMCEASPGLSEAVLATCPQSATASLETIRTLSAGSGLPVSTADAAALWLASLLTMLASAGTVLGIYVIVRRHWSADTAWIIAGLWPLVPVIAIFHPKSDTLYPFLAVTATALWMTAGDRRSLLRAALAGWVLWMGMLLSLAFVTVGALLVAMTLWEWILPRVGSAPPELDMHDRRMTTSRQLSLLVAGAVGFLLPTLLFSWQNEINLLNVWRWNLSNHALFYEHNERTWWAWLLVNPWELAYSVGLSICAAAGLSLWELRKHAAWAAGRAGLPMGFIAVWGLLWLSGKNMGEAARLWILLMPWVVMSAATHIESHIDLHNTSKGHSSSQWLLSPPVWLLVAQMVVCVLTVLRIDGFHLSEMLISAGPP